jgi:Lrp/AsnC family transcriptional regulator for asnA, asnC and gidA
MIYNLDNLDKKILYYLDRNSRQSASKIAKNCRVHKNVVNFRINRLVERGVIRQFVAMISPSVLGLVPYKIYLQLQNLTNEKEKKLIKILNKFPVYWAARVSGRWDFIIGLLVRNLQEFSEVYKRILSEFGEDILNKTISILTEAPHYYRKYLHEEKNPAVKYWIEDTKKQEIDEIDHKILKILANNSRTPVVELSEKIKISVKTCISRIKNLEKKGIIYDYRISLNLEKIGYKFFKCFISLKTAEKSKLSEFLEYCRQNKNIVHLVECIGEWELEPEFEIESYEKFQETISEIRNKFSDVIKGIETINILKEYYYTCIPI